MSKSKLLSVVPLKEVRELADLLLRKKVDPDLVIVEVAELIDGLVDWTEVLPAPAGVLAELADGELAKVIARAIVKAAEKKAAKAAA